MEIITVPAKPAALEIVNTFIQEKLQTIDCSKHIRMQLKLAVEEIFVNISSYAYHPGIGQVEVGVLIDSDPPTVTIRFLDQGHPFNPLKQPDADISLSAQDREIGGLGILLVKKTMDQVNYTYENGKNILTIKKEIE
ncbi:MAG: ATP-binding protein [Firmicutes bacterium]|nr:ATP-binding protein [Bacillota bacterium]